MNIPVAFLFGIVFGSAATIALMTWAGSVRVRRQIAAHELSGKYFDLPSNDAEDKSGSIGVYKKSG